MAGRIFFDFDGTLIDSHTRIYNLFMELVPESRFSYHEYWQIKRNRMNQRDLLRTYFCYTDEQIQSFKQKWLENIEDPARLELDVPFAGVTELLRKCSCTHELYLVTARQFPERAIAQVHHFGWSPYFTDIFVTQQKQSKSSLIREKLKCSSTDTFVSDTGEDIISGKELGMKTVAVSSGVLSVEILKEYQPDMIIDNVVNLDAA